MINLKYHLWAYVILALVSILIYTIVNVNRTVEKCHNNVIMDSLRRILKQDLIYRRHGLSRCETMEDIKKYIEVFYNQQRLQAGLGYL